MRLRILATGRRDAPKNSIPTPGGAPMAPIDLPRSPSHPAGEVVAGRFHVVRFIARGGMGEVYEAEDLTLHERVALKVVRPDAARDQIDLLLREVQLARKVTHPNVCRIFDLGQHIEGPDRVAFVTMELLVGENLGERLRRGRLSTQEALPLVRQVVAALAAAHKAGVVHRDFKSENVALVPAPTEEGGIRAVVTDFGLARGRESEGEVGHVVGTPAYMAPEQMEARQVTAAWDIYALGIVMYEMVTGRLPFPGGTLAEAARRLTERPRPPRELVPDLDPTWERVILRCLERDPIDRFASVGDVARALAGEEVTPGRKELVERHTRTRAWRRWGPGLGLVALVAIALAAGVLWQRRPPPPSPSAGAGQPRRSVAVLGFKNLSERPDTAWLSTALSEMLSTELRAGEQLRLIPGEVVARTKIELAVPEADALAKDTLERIRRNLGSDLVVLGSYFAAGKEGGGKLRLDLRLQETKDGQTVASLSDTGTEAELIDLVSRTGAELR